MYKGHSIWDEEEDKYDNHTGEISGDYHGGGKGDYRKQEDYASNEGKSDEDYAKRQEEEEKKKEKSEFEKKVDDNLPQKKYAKKESPEEAVRKKAAEEIGREMEGEKRKVNKNSKSSKSIEDAIKKAVEEEKEVIRP